MPSLNELFAYTLGVAPQRDDYMNRKNEKPVVLLEGDSESFVRRGRRVKWYLGIFISVFLWYLT